MECLVRVPEELEEEIHDRRGSRSIDKVNQVFRFIARDNFTPKEVYLDGLSEKGGELPTTAEAGKGRGSEKILLKEDEIDFWREKLEDVQEQACEIQEAVYG
jgi:hypothetical protein